MRPERDEYDFHASPAIVLPEEAFLYPNEPVAGLGVRGSEMEVNRASSRSGREYEEPRRVHMQ